MRFKMKFCETCGSEIKLNKLKFTKDNYLILKEIYVREECYPFLFSWHPELEKYANDVAVLIALGLLEKDENTYIVTNKGKEFLDNKIFIKEDIYFQLGVPVILRGKNICVKDYENK